MGGWNKGKALIDWNARVKDKFGESFRLIAIGEPNRSGERVIRVECSICGTIKDVSSISFRGKHGKDGHCEMCSPDYHLNDYLLLMKRARVEKQIKEQNEKIETEKRKTSKRLKSKQVGLRFCKECNLAINETDILN